MTNIGVKYEVWKNKLLDLGKRNRLINYKDTARSSVKIEYPECSALYNMFVKQEMELIFPFENYGYDISEIEYVPNIKTNKSDSDLQKVLRNLRNKAKTSVEERGVNILYLCFGFLKWTESESSNQFFASPLILVPVTLMVESIMSPYILKLHEDEIVLNPTLVYKLENDFGISLPIFDDNHNIDDFFEEVKTKINLKKWSISKEVSLSLLSFLKINMYLDLNLQKERILENHIIKAISGEASTINRIPDEMVNFDFDRQIKPMDVFQIIDADNSQQEAIIMAKKGVSFVLQGPPGTGKSQTITNIIAECLAEGKKVLFVSEKMAALDVVYRRLSNAGLEDFALVLHSYKASKRSVLEQLEKALDISRKKIALSDEVYQKLDMLQINKEKLNAYADEIYQPIAPMGKSIYEVNGIIANLDGYNDYIFPIGDIRNITKEKYNKYIYLLSQFATTIGKMTNDFKNNPWRECRMTSVTNEFRHDVTFRLNKLLPLIKKFDENLAEVFVELYIDAPHTIYNVNQIITVLQIVESPYKIPYEWMLIDEIQPLYDEIFSCIEIKNNLLSLKDELRNKYSIIQSNVSISNLSNIDLLNNVTVLINEKNKLENLISSKKPYSRWNNESIGNITLVLSQAIEIADKVKALKNELLEVYEPSVFDLDYKSLFIRIKTKYASFTKIFKKEYREDKKKIKFYRKDIVKSISDEEMLYLVERLRKIDETRQWFTNNIEILKDYFDIETINENTDFLTFKKCINAFNSTSEAIKIIIDMIEIFNNINNKESIFIEYYKFFYKGIFSDWETIYSALNWTVLFKESISKVEISNSFIKAVCEENEFIDICKRNKEKLEEIKRLIHFEYIWFISNFDNPEIFDKTELSNLYFRINDCSKRLFLLEEWIDFSSARKKCLESGLEEFIYIIGQNNISSEFIIPIFKKRFFRLWLDAVLPEFPAVQHFRRKVQEKIIDEFSSLDILQFEIAKARIKSKLISKLPSFEHFTNGFDEISILKREISKQRKIMPIRRLFKNIPNLLLTLKPCLMMSPLSVSLFLETETYKFDIVIFDEASQICTENAIGAILRANQVVIAGDSKQLPPTNFFQTSVSDDDFDTLDEEDEFDDSDAYDSILDEANMLPERTLRWHYRSKHESLIAFSNAKIYKNKLITFPSNIEKMKNNGVEYFYVSDGYYDRGGRCGNIVEAKKVAELVFKHFEEQPNRSLGVIAFGEVQQQVIESVIREIRINNPHFEYFFAEDKEEAFFVKNLENVQGDERDTIIFSIGYAKDSMGTFKMNFGPLSKFGGERRLNVAITRAKYNIKLVGSIMPTDIDTDKISSEGPKLLRTYIDFAINGFQVLEREVTESDIVEHDSPFEESVYNFLDRKGYKLVTQVGCSGYKIDMAVKHPALSGIYVIGIECDGATYHSARSARERDRLRQDILEKMGWKIYRIWSTDWIKDPIAEGEKLVEVVEDAIASYGVDEKFLKRDLSRDVEKSNLSNYINYEDINISIEQTRNPYSFEKSEVSSFSDLPRDKDGYLELTDCIMEVIKTEYPIHYELICQRLAPLYGNEKATVKIRRELDIGLSQLGEKVLRKGDFLFPSGYNTVPVRIPNNRKIQHISIEELSEAMIRILKTGIGTTKRALCSETTRVYGFNRAGQNISSAMYKALNDLIATGRVEEIEGKLKIKI